MPKPTLFVCKSCHNDAAQADLETPLGTLLFNRLNELHTDSSFVIKGEECLWMCERACVVAIAATDKPTYLCTDLPIKESAEALLKFANVYVNHKGKSIPAQKFPEVLESANIARIPSI
ncbi:MAG: DUF1636 domain-containing protein [Cyanobacteria bacterium J06642_3]